VIRRDQFLLHVTLTTGHVRRSYRDEISDDSVEGARLVLERALHERVRMPQLGPEIALTVTAEGRSAMIATIWDGQAPVVTFGVARHSRASAGLWPILLRTSTPELTPIVVDDTMRPEPPWVAARIEVGASRVPPMIMMAIGGLEAVFGWAFLDLQSNGRQMPVK
jgi:hypothetical protein